MYTYINPSRRAHWFETLEASKLLTPNIVLCVFVFCFFV